MWPRNRCTDRWPRPVVHRYWPADGRQQQWALHAHIGSIALCRSGRLLLALEDDFHFLDPDSAGSPLWACRCNTRASACA
ncbi:SMP-30/gluconolactonase/LRE family protein [Comamonas sp. JC664]|uniref:SMP-30/gluconolactonase/LRE family protein n=1 Tax=Comamonas sp. JC664 TaxID=2801917 RepID=UPI0036219E72